MGLWQYQGHDFKACAEQLSFNPSTSIFGFPPGASAPQPPVLLNLTSYKDAWTNYGSNIDSVGNMPEVNIGGCTTSEQGIMNMPPFVEDRVSMFFTHIGVGDTGTQGPGNERISADQKYSPFVDVESKKDANGNCATYVVLGNNATMGGNEY